MSGALNCCMFIGNLGADPESRSFPNGGEVVNLRMACTETWKDKQSGEKRERTEWVSVAIFGPLCNVAKSYLKKGSKLYVCGKMQTRKWQDQSGNDRYSTEIVLQGPQAQLILLDGRRDNAAGGGGQAGSSGDQQGGGYGGGGTFSGSRPQPATFDTDLDDDVPFISNDPSLEWRVR